MSKLIGVLQDFSKLNKIVPEEIRQWINPQIEHHIIENYLANRILYPQTVPTTTQELEMDLAIFHEAIRQTPEVVYTASSHKITIPANLIPRFGSIQNILICISDVIDLKESTPVFIKGNFGPSIGEGSNLVGTLIKLTSLPRTKELVVRLNGLEVKVKANSLSLVPSPDHHVQVQINNHLDIMAAGGEIGIAFDLRPVG